MSDTDNAFIRAYRERDVRHTVCENVVGAVSDPAGSQVATGRVAMSQFYAASPEGVILSVDTTSPALDRLSGEAHPGSALERCSNERRLRLDDMDPVLPPRPHLDAARFGGIWPSFGEGSPRTDGTRQAIQPATTEPVPRGPFRAAWDVDGFHWPEVCGRLMDRWTSRLSEVVRPLLRKAWQGHNVVAVTRFGRGEGGTTVALCLARLAASFNVPVALVDGDHLSPEIGHSLGIEPRIGWNANAPDGPLGEVAVASVSDRLVVFPLQRSPKTILSQQNGPAVAQMLHELAGQFELVIVDVGPMFVAAYHWFQSPVANQVHAALVVRDMRCRQLEEVDDVCQRLAHARIDQVAIVENFQPM
jgi:Mrp family chromosome partitioning ATPase